MPINYNRNTNYLVALLMLVLLQKNVRAQVVNGYNYTSQKSKTVTSAGVVSAHPLASKVGLLILKQGGNAFDAAIAVQLTLAVVYPGAGNIGGGGFMVARQHNGNSLALDYRETAPAKATRDMYLDSAGNAQTNLSQNGHLAAGIPGSIAGMYATLPYCKLKWATLIQPAINYARNGFAITAAEASNLNAARKYFVQHNTHTPALVKSTAWKTGDTLIQNELANTLVRIKEKGAKGFYQGETAKLIVAEMGKRGGIITLDDLKNYQPKVRKVLAFNYKKNYTIITMPPPSSGGILLAQMLNMLEDRAVNDMPFQSADQVQLVTEVERRAYADRAAHLGDADYYPVPIKVLTSKAYATMRMANYTANTAQISTNIQAGEIHKESEETTHISIIDKAGNMVSVTTTLNGNYGSKTVVDGAGFLLNNEMDDFSIKPGVPNMYGAIGGEANCIQPGKRMLSSMTPTLVLKNNKPYLVIGTPGGTTIITSVLQTILNIIEYDMTAADAVNKPKFHHQWLPDVIYTEPAFNKETSAKLKAMGYSIEPRGLIGRTELIKIIGKNKIELAADIRGDDSAEGY